MNELNSILRHWIARLRLQRGVMWAARGFAFGLGFALLFGSVALLQANLLKNEFLLLTVLSAAIFSLLFGLTAFLWRIHPLQAARYFDVQFGLGERVSTALELGGAGELGGKQLEDAIRMARKINPARRIPLGFKKKDAGLAILFALSLAALWWRGEEMFAIASQQRKVESALARQEIQLEEIIQAVESNEALSDEQKQKLTEPLQAALNELKQTETLEGGVSILTSTAEAMQALGGEGGETMQALEQAGGSLAAHEGSPMESIGKELASGNFAKAASNLANMDLSQMTPQQLNDLANQLDEMASQLEAANPQMAQDLKDAAQKIREGDLQAARQSLNSASQQMAQTAQQAAASQAASQAAGQLQQGAGNLLAAGGGQAGNSQANSGQMGTEQQGGAGGGSGSGDGATSNQAGRGRRFAHSAK